MARPIQTVDPGITDTFCSGLGKIEHIGPCVRITFTVPETESGRTSNFVVAKLVMPAAAWAAIAAGNHPIQEDATFPADLNSLN